MGFWPSKTVLSAVELGLFTQLGDGLDDRRGDRASGSGLHPRAIPDFLDTLVALGFLERDGDGRRGALSQHRRDRRLPRQEQPGLHRRDPRDGERPPLPVLGRSDRGAQDGRAAERGQAHRHSRCSRSSTAIRRGSSSSCSAMAGISRGNFQALAEKFDFSGTRRSATSAARPASCRIDRRRAAPPPALHELRPAGRRADRGADDRGRRARGSRRRRRRATSSPIRCQRPTSSRWA